MSSAGNSCSDSDGVKPKASMKPKPLLKAAYSLALILLSSLTLVIFLRPTESHEGINQYYRATFLDMVEGKAYRPYVYRALMPTAVRAVSMLAPAPWQHACAGWVERYGLAKRAFRFFRWENRAAFQYLTASFLMLLCFMGFGHMTVKLTEKTCVLPGNGYSHLLLLVVAMLGLPPFFVYTSYLYDPAQLFLFTLALFFLASQRSKAFFIVFIACCINKETAVLLVPLFGLMFRSRYPSRLKYWATMAGLMLVFIASKGALAWIFRDNPGSFVEIQLERNVRFLIKGLSAGWTFTCLLVFLAMTLLVFYRWKEKPRFLRLSLLCILPSLAALSLFLGFVDEWRIYYEAYPLIFASSVHTLFHFRTAS